MIDNHRLPVGFTVELVQRSDISNRFVTLPEPEQGQVMNGTREVKDRDEMHNYMESMLRGQELAERQKGTGKADTSFRPFLLFF